jgi:hypothetical protein
VIELPKIKFVVFLDTRICKKWLGVCGPLGRMDSLIREESEPEAWRV